jgi:hypothetical protein
MNPKHPFPVSTGLKKNRIARYEGHAIQMVNRFEW